MIKNTMRNVTIANGATFGLAKQNAIAAANYYGKPSWHGLKPASYAVRLTLAQRVANHLLGRKVY